VIGVAKNLYWYDYLDKKDVDLICRGKSLTDREKVRDLDRKQLKGDYSFKL